MAQIRLFDIRDVSLVQRLSPLGRPLAYEPVAVHGLNPLHEAMRGYVYVGYDHSVTLVRRDSGARELDSFGLMSLIPGRGGDLTDTKYASMLFAAPYPQNDDLTVAWTELAEAFVAYASERGVQCIVAETPENSNEAYALRRIGFSVVMHQDIMKLVSLPEDVVVPEVIGLRPQEDKDEAYIKLLSMRVVPKLVQKAEANTDISRLNHQTDCGYILLRDQEPLGNISMQHGRRGYGMQLLFRPDAEDIAEPMLRYALSNLCGGRHRPVYCMVPTYQSWLLPTLDNIGFTHITSNAIMIKRTTASVRQPVWTLQAKHANTKLINSETKLQTRETPAQHKS
jgi:hypothetical protein